MFLLVSLVIYMLFVSYNSHYSTSCLHSLPSFIIPLILFAGFILLNMLASTPDFLYIIIHNFFICFPIFAIIIYVNTTEFGLSPNLLNILCFRLRRTPALTASLEFITYVNVFYYFDILRLKSILFLN